MSVVTKKPGDKFRVPDIVGEWVAQRSVSDGGCQGCEVPTVAGGRSACAKFPECCSFEPGKSLVFKRKREG